MSGTLVDTNVLLDLFTDDPVWADWSQNALEVAASRGAIYINPVIYSEVSSGFDRIGWLESSLNGCGLRLPNLPKEALFLAGKVFHRYRARSGHRRWPLPDFYIGAHAAVAGLKLLTRDRGRFRADVPTLQLIIPPEGPTME